VITADDVLRLIGGMFAWPQLPWISRPTSWLAAQALPVIGALGGAAVNYAFIEHFQDIARGHFTVRRLERIYGKEKVRSEYDLIASEF
jgi:hypothetical protein